MKGIRHLSILATILAGLMIWHSPVPADADQLIKVEGSTSMAEMVYQWAKDFMKDHPTINVEVNAVGTQVGLRSLQERRVQVATASRKIHKDELGQFSSKNMRLVETKVGMEGVAVVVNKANPVNVLTREQLTSVLSGASKSWSDFGGPDQPITLVARNPAASGTSIYLQDELLKGGKFHAKTLYLEYYDWVVKEVEKNHQWGLGVAAFSFADPTKVKILAIKEDNDSPAVAPSRKTFLDGSYPLTRPFFLYTLNSAPSPVKTFVEYCKGKGQK